MSLLDGITLHSEANMNLNQPEPLYRNLTDTYLSWSTDSGVKNKTRKAIGSIYSSWFHIFKEALHFRAW